MNKIVLLKDEPIQTVLIFDIINVQFSIPKEKFRGLVDGIALY
jgi:hypothetical protein